MPLGQLYPEAFIRGHRKSETFFCCHNQGLGLTSRRYWRDLLWAFRERGRTPGRHTPPTVDPLNFCCLLCRQHWLGWGRGPRALSPSGLVSQTVLPPWEVPSCLRPTGGRTEIGDICLSGPLAPPSPPTRPRLFLQEPPNNRPPCSAGQPEERQATLFPSERCSPAFHSPHPSPGPETDTLHFWWLVCNSAPCRPSVQGHRGLGPLDISQAFHLPVDGKLKCQAGTFLPKDRV